MKYVQLLFVFSFRWSLVAVCAAVSVDGRHLRRLRPWEVAQPLRVEQPRSAATAPAPPPAAAPMPPQLKKGMWMGATPPVALVPDFAEGRWRWAEPGEAATNAAPPSGAPGPAALVAPAPGPGPAPATPDVCNALKAAGDQSTPGQFMECQEYRFYAQGPLGTPTPQGCHCSAWSTACPFETCGARAAWEESCLAPEAAALGFTALSRSSHPLDAGVLPEPMGGFKDHPGIISLCMYWLPKPAKQQLPPVSVSAFDFTHSYANIHLSVADVFDCLRMTSSPLAISQTKAAVAAALGGGGVTAVSVNCGGRTKTGRTLIFNALLRGPPAQLELAEATAATPGFCVKVPEVPAKFCAGSPPGPGPAPAPQPAPAPAPGPAPAPAVVAVAVPPQLPSARPVFLPGANPTR